MQVRRLSVRSRLLASVMVGLFPVTAFAGDTTVGSGQTVGQVQFSGSDHVTVSAGGTVAATGQSALVMTGDSTGVVIDNAGLINSDSGYGIFMPFGTPRSGPITINNTGSIQGLGIYLAEATGPVTITNSGAIQGGATAITTGTGSDVLNLSTGSTIPTAVQLGAGLDTINLTGTSPTRTTSQVLGSVFGVETLNVNSGYWILNRPSEINTINVATSGPTLEIDKTGSSPAERASLSSTTGGPTILTGFGSVVINTDDTRIPVTTDFRIQEISTLELRGGGVLQYSNNFSGNTYTTVTNGTLLVNRYNVQRVTLGEQGTLRIGAALSAPDADGFVTIQSGGGYGSVADNIYNSGRVIYDLAVDDSYGYTISGTGALTKQGTGTLTFTNDQTYTGLTTIESGVLKLGNGGTKGSVAGNIVNNAGLIIDRANDVTYAGSISGTGTLTKSGPGVLALTGANTYTGATTLSAGGLYIAGPFASSGIATASNTSLSFITPGAMTYAGVISGTGIVEKRGAGVLTLSGASTNTNGMNITAGKVVLSGSVVGPMFVASDASFDVTSTGSARLVTGSGATVTNAGTISTPGITTGAQATVNFSTLNNTLTNSGVIRSFNGNAVRFGGGNDTLNLATGSSIIGRVEMGGGTDTINVAGTSATKTTSQSFGDIFGSEALNVNSGYWTLTGEVNADVVTIANGATFEVDDANNQANGGAFITSNGQSLSIVDNGAVILNTADTRTDIYADNLRVSGAGTLQLTGGGTMQWGKNFGLTGAATITNGTVVVSGDNIATPVTVASQGTLRVGAAFSAPDADGYVNIVSGGGTTGSLTGNIANNGQVNFDRANTSTYAGVMSGSGALTKSGAGTLTLTGQNTFSGTTTIAAGTLQIGNGGATGSLSGPIVNNGVLAYNRSGAGVLSNISGSGSLNVVAGNLTLGGANTYTGGTTVSGDATLGLSGAVTGDIVNNGTVNFGLLSAGSYSGAMSGTGALSVIGIDDDVLTLTGANTFTGGIAVYDRNTLQIGAGGTAGSVVSDIVDNGTVMFNRSDSTTYAGSITGAGRVFKAGSGVLTLSGANAYTGTTTVTGGGLVISAPLASSGVFLAGGTSLTFTGPNAMTYAGVVWGAGGLVKTGAGVLTLAGANTHTGGTNVQAGGLRLTGSLVGLTSLASGTTLEVAAGGAARTVVGNGVTVINAGTIETPLVTTGTAASIGLGDAGNTVTNSGLIRSYNGNAVRFGAEADTLNLSTGSSIVGRVEMGGGADVINLAGTTATKTGSQTFGDIFGSETLNVNSGYWTLNKEVEADFVNVASGATLEMDSVGAAPGQGGFISGNAAFKTVVDNGAIIQNTSDTRLDDGADTLHLSGSGTVELKGGGALQYGANVSLTGATTVTNGTLVVTGDNIASALDVGSQGVVRIGAAFSAPDADGYVTLVAGGGTTGSVAGNIANNGAVIFDRADASTYAGAMSGTGAVTKSGAGVLTLSGANTYTGTTTVAGGGLVVSAPFASSGVSLAGGTGLTFTGPNALTYAGVVSGAGGLAKTGTGVATLSGANTYTGATTVGAGGLTVTGSIASQAVSVASGATFTFGSSADQTYGGVISGAGSLGKSGAGSLTLTGANSYTGGTTVSGGSLILPTTLVSDVTVAQGGTLQIGTGGTTGSLTGDLVANGTVIFNRSDDYLFAGDFSGNGSLIKRGAGLLTLDGLYTFSGSTVIEAGTIKITQLDAGGSLVVGDGASVDLSGSNQTVGGLTGGSGSTVNIEDATLTINQPPGGTPTVFNGTLSGDGALVVTGDGVFDLAGTNTYTGPTTVDGGTLKVNGSITSTVTVNDGGTLGGSGTIGGAVTVGSGGAISPGNSPGVTTIAGPLTLASGSSMIVEVDPTATVQNDRINVTAGSATIAAGAKLDVRPLGAIANYDRVSDYTILTASGGVNGTFGANVTSTMALLTPSVSYSTNEVKLRLIRNDISFASLADTANQAAVADAAEATGSSGAAYGALIGQDEAGARAGYDALSGELYGTAGSLMIDEGRHQRAVLLRQAASGDRGAWASLYNGEVKSDAGAGYAASRNKSFGLTGGGQTSAGAWNLGFALGFSDSDIEVLPRSSVNSVETLRAGVYGGRDFYDDTAIDRVTWRVRFGADLAKHGFEAKRGIAFPTVTESVAADYDGASQQVFGEVAYNFAVGPGNLEPFVEIAAVRSKTDAFTETGGTLGLSVSEQERDVTFATIGARYEASFDTGGGAVVRPQLSLAWRRAGGDIEGTSTAAFGTSGFTVVGAGVAKDTALIDAGAGFDITSSVTGSLSYSGAVSSDAKDHAIRAGLFVRF